MNCFSKSARMVCLAIAACLLFGSVSASTQEKSPGGWEKEFEVYGWLPDINITTAEGDKIELTLGDILSNLDMFAMLDFDLRKSRLTMGVDTIYMNLGDTITTTANVIGHPEELTAVIDMRAFISTAHAGYQVTGDDQHRLDVIGGVRYLYIRLPLEFDIEDIDRVRNVTLDGHNWNGIVGLQGKKVINDKWYFDYYGDIGTGGADLTWQVKAGFGYHFNKFTGTFGLRYMRWDFSDDDDLKDLDVIGPYIGARWFW